MEYGTGVVVSDDGAILADRQITDGCLTVAIAGFRQCRSRCGGQGARSCAAAHLWRTRTETAHSPTPPPKTTLDLTGIADPQNQGGGAAVTGVKASVVQLGGGSDIALTPAPALGFSGAAALDGDGRFAGVSLLKPVQVAGSTDGVPAAQAVLVTADTVRSFLKTNGVTAAGASADAKASVVRVICVRK